MDEKYQKALERHGLPDLRARMSLASAAHNELEKYYIPIGLDHFAHADDSMALALQDHRLRQN